jgi:hypothetical protein
MAEYDSIFRSRLSRVVSSQGHQSPPLRQLLPVHGRGDRGRTLKAAARREVIKTIY